MCLAASAHTCVPSEPMGRVAAVLEATAPPAQPGCMGSTQPYLAIPKARARSQDDFFSPYPLFCNDQQRHGDAILY